MLAAPLFNEIELLLKIGSGENAAFGKLYQHYYTSVYKLVLKYLKSPELAEDITQEIFLKIWESRDNLSQVRSFRSYLFVVVRNHTLNMLKAAAGKQVMQAELVRCYHAGSSNATDEILDHEYQKFLDKELASLPPRAGEVFNLCRKQLKTYQEVAAELGISRNAVKNHMVHSIKILKRSVEKELGISIGMLLAFIFL